MARSKIGKNWSSHPVEKYLAQGVSTNAVSLSGKGRGGFCLVALMSLTVVSDITREPEDC
jgi:hypothetical protein